MSHAVPIAVGRHRDDTVGGVRRARSTSAPRTPGRPGLRRTGTVLLNVVLATCLLGFVLLAVGPHVLGYRTATMLTGSMAPDIMPGDVVVTVPQPAADVQVGDVISYQIPIEDHRVETHRVSEVVKGADGSVTVRTKGDANANVDPWTAVLDDDTVWEVRGVVPEVGTVIRALHHPLVSKGLLWVSLVGLVLVGLATIWSKGGDVDAAEGVEA